MENFLGKYQTCPQELNEFPIKWDKLFSRNKELVVEIGFGGGEYLVELAKASPNYNYIGIENSLTSCLKIQKKIYRNNLNNVRIIFEDAKFALREFFGDNSIYKVIVNFPCPWPKSKHQKRRLIDESFIETLSSVLEIGGKFFLTSDVFWYVSQVKENFNHNGCFETSKIFEDFQLPFKTKYQKKWEEAGRNKFLFKATKKKSKNIKRLLKGEDNLPHKKIKTLNIEKLYSLKGYKKSERNATFIIKDIYSRLGDSEYLLKVFSDDEGFQQSYFISIIKINTEWLIKLDDIAKAYRTPAVKESVFLIAEEIEADV